MTNPEPDIIFSRQQIRFIFLTSLGGALELYDFVIFGFFAKVISQLYFSPYAHSSALLTTFTIFAAGYMSRPTGGLIFGHYGDKYGRKKVFVYSVFLMAIPTLLLGLIPTSQHIGLLAPLLLVFLRLLQGLSIGGEIPGAIVYITETAPPAHRGVACGFIFFGMNLGLLLGSLVGVILTSLLTDQQFLDWGWRIAFILGGSLCLISFQLRKNLTETTCFIQQEKRSVAPLASIYAQYKSLVLKSIAATWIGAAAVGIFFLYLPTYLVSHTPVVLKQAFLFNSINIAVFAISVIPMCYLSDTIGRKKVLLAGITVLMLMSYPLFLMLQTGNSNIIITAGIVAALITSSITGCYPGLLAELFPAAVRYSGFALSYNVGTVLFGALAPLIATSLITLMKTPMAPGYYLIFSAGVSFMAILSLPELSAAKDSPPDKLDSYR